LHYFAPSCFRILFERATGAVLVSNLPIDSSSKAKSTYWDLKDSGKTPFEVLQRIPIGGRPINYASLLSLSPFKSLFSNNIKTYEILIN